MRARAFSIVVFLAATSLKISSTSASRSRSTPQSKRRSMRCVSPPAARRRSPCTSALHSRLRRSSRAFGSCSAHDERARRALRIRRAHAAELLEEERLRIEVDVLELEAEAETVIARTTPVDDARDRRLRVEPIVRARRLEADDQLLAGEHALLRTNEHALRREIEREVGDDLEVVLSDDLA